MIELTCDKSDLEFEENWNNIRKSLKEFFIIGEVI
jgi:hypothetical protein